MLENGDSGLNRPQIPLTPGCIIGHYRIQSKIGAGGMGEVYRARDTRLERDVAIKILPQELACDQDRLAQFEREAKIVAALNHPNVVVLHSLEDNGGLKFLTMEFIDGQSLDRLIEPGGIPLMRVLELSIAIADALTAAHEHDIVHRDLKPSNVMVNKEGRIKVLDFGLAKVNSPTGPDDATRGVADEIAISKAGQIVGTMPYMAPEQWRGESADARTDLFALGIIIYELATGKKPFTGTTSADLSSAVLRDVPRPLQVLRSDAPGDLQRIVSRCLEKERDRRFQTAKDVRNELELVLREQALPGSSLPGSSQFQAAAAAPDVPSIAVLPFVNRSNDQVDEYFSDGLADELLNMLSKIRGLRVAARTSSSSFKGKNEDVTTIGQKLRVATLLEGSVRKVGNRVRIAVQLIKVSDGFQLWSETYDRTLDDIFIVQDDIAQAVVKEMRTTLLSEAPDSKASGEIRVAVKEAARGRSEDSEAHRLLLQGRYFIERYSREDVAKGVVYLRQSLELDPDSAAVWATLSQALIVQGSLAWIPSAQGFEEARFAAHKALALEPNLAEGYIACGQLQSYQWEWKEAAESFRRALELAPHNSAALRGASFLAADLGRIDEALDLSRRAILDDPLSAQAFMVKAIVSYYAGLPDEALAAFQKAREFSPQRANTHSYIAIILGAQGHYEEALSALEGEPVECVRLWGEAVVFHLAGRKVESDQSLRRLITEFGGDAGYQIAQVCGTRGEVDDAFTWLEHAYTCKDPGLSDVRTDPSFLSLRADDRWEPFLNKMRLLD